MKREPKTDVAPVNAGTKDVFPSLSFDGCGINGRDEYRTRIATFSNDAEKYGPLFAASPELLEALKQIAKTGLVPGYESICALKLRIVGAQSIARAAIARAEGRQE